MKSTILALAVLIGFGTTGCGSAPETCQTMQCGQAASKTYQRCISADSNAGVRYTLGDSSCQCPDGVQTDCLACNQQLSSYCTH